VAIAVVAENLMAHAVHATPAHGVIHVEIAGEPGHVVVSVRDSGPGLTSEEQKEIFRMPAAATKAGNGIEPRMGLVIADDFVRRMDGQLWCDSKIGQGARFSFRLPAVG
jgi:signal transduction histidine kinase